MCGIAGFLNYDFTDSYFEEVNTLQLHRGPDAQDSFQHENIRLYHQRLAIIDISAAANQPFRKDKYVIIFNGEIYNYKHLRQQLIAEKSTRFSTNSDTEVLLELYREKGAACLQELQGMFAFAIYNTETKELFLARDHFGIKPLFYYSNSMQFAFASELKTLIKAPKIKKDINFLSLTATLNYLWLPGNETMFEGIHKLPPGSYATVSSEGNITIKPYYTVPSTTHDFSEAEAIEQLDEILNRSITRHLEADVPVSAFLSGGLDSSLLSVLAKQQQALSTYSIAFGRADKRIEQMPDDALYARKVAAQFGMDHHEILINPNIIEHLPFMVYHLDEPIGDPAAINTYLISKAARDNGVKVLLSGMGADELFFGYRRQRATLEAIHYQKMPGLVKTGIGLATNLLPVRIGNKGIKTTRWAKRFLSFANLPPAEAYQRSYSYYDRDGLNKLLTRDAIAEIDTLYKSHRDIFDTGFEGDVINKMCFTDVPYFMQGLNLTYTDRASMAASVEVRVPFIDKEVVNFALAVPGSLKYKHRKQKYLLKKVAERYLPKEIIYRPKASFGAPIRSWISGELDPMVNDLLNPKAVRDRGLFDTNEVSRLINNNKAGKADNAYQIYQLLTTELWFREFVD